MNEADVERLASILEQIRETQRLQLERQTESLALQREQAAGEKQFLERKSALLDREAVVVARAEGVNAKSERLTGFLWKLVIGMLVLAAIVVPATIWLEMWKAEHPSGAAPVKPR